MRQSLKVRVAMGVFFAGTALANAEPLEAWRWEKRPVLIFSPSLSDNALQLQKRIFGGERAGLADRDITLTVIEGGRVSALFGPALTTSADRLRQRYGIRRGQFAVLLIGKDGGVKLRSTKPVSIDRLYSLIDAMPMRRREMRGN